MNVNALFGVVYRPPNTESIQNLPNELLNLIPRYTSTIIMGDFNHNLAIPQSFAITSFWNAGDLTLIHNKKTPILIPLLATVALLTTLLQKELVKYKNQFWLSRMSNHDFIYIAVDLPCRINDEPNKILWFKIN